MNTEVSSQTWDGNWEKKKNNIAFQWLYKAFNGDDGKNMVVGE